VQIQAATVPSTLLPLKPYVDAAPAGFVLDAPASVLATVDPSALAGLRSYYALITKSVANGELKLSGGT
jgi:hypothetical protein